MPAYSALNEFKNYCENVWEGGGGTFQGYVQFIDSLGYPNGYPCGDLILNEGWITSWTCNTCTSKKITDSLQIDKNLCGDICRKSNLSCSYIFGDISGNYYGTAYPSCGATDSTIVGCEELESSSSTEESSSSGEGEGGEDEESSSSGAGGGGEEGESSSSGESINPGEDEDDGGFICNYYSPGDPFDSTGLCLTSGFIGTQFYNPPTQIGGYNAIKDSIWIKCDYNEVSFHSYIGQIRINSEYQQKKYCYTNSNCISDVQYIVNVGESYECVYSGGEIGVGCPIPVPINGIDYFLFVVGSNGRLYYDGRYGSNVMPSNISLDELLNGKYDVYEDFPRQGLLGAQVSLQEAYTICDSVWNYENDTPPDTSSIPETFSSSSAEGGENPPIDPPEGLTSSSAEGGGDNPPIGGNSSSGSGGSIGGGGGGITNGTGGRDESKAEEVYSSFMDKYSFSPLDTSGGTEGNYALREDVWKIYDILKDFASMMKEGVASLLGYGEAIIENTDTLRHDLKLSLINDSTSIDLQISIDSLLRIIANSPIKFDSSYQETYDNGWSAVQQWMKSTIRTGSSGGSGGTVDSSWSLAVVDTSNNIIAQKNLDTLEAIRQLLQAYFTTAWIQQDSSIKLSHEMDSLLNEVYITQTSLETSNAAIATHTSNTASNTSSIASSNGSIATNTGNIYGILNAVIPLIRNSQDTASKYSKETFNMLNGGTFMTAMGYVAYGLNGTLSGQYNGMQALLTGQHNALMTGINGLGGGLDSGFGGLSTLLDTNLNVKGNPGDTSGSGGYWDGISGEGEADGDGLINSIFGFGESYADSVYEDATNSDSSNTGKDTVVYSYDSLTIKSHLDSSVKQDSIQFVNKLTSVFDTLRKEFLLVDFDSLLMGDIGAKVPNTNTCPEHCFKGTINTDTEYLKTYNYDIGICSWKIFGLDALQFIRLILRLLTAFSCVYIGVWALSGRR